MGLEVRHARVDVLLLLKDMIKKLHVEGLICITYLKTNKIKRKK
jgi:hypothetical protein